ncbi:MAG TPA: AAA family ATPase [Acholeplasmataceae bacterium]|nr:AAA family ATPase [Acholeplasmataceae bacterium]
MKLSLKGKNLTYDQLPSNSNKLSFYYLENRFKRVKNIKNFNNDILVTLGLIANDKYTIAAELLSDENSMNSSGIDIVRFGKSISQFLERKTIKNESLLKQLDETLHFFEKNYPKIEVVEGFNRVKKSPIPFEAFREALANAIVHRDYSINSLIKISMYDNRVEIVSPGGLPEGLCDLRDYLSIPRNIIVAQIFFMLGIIEKFGTGIKRIRDAYKSHFLKPKFDIKENMIRVVLPNMLFDDSNMLPEIRIMNLIEMQLEIRRIDVEKKLNVNKSKAIELLKKLVDKNLITTKGNGRNQVYVIND